MSKTIETPSGCFEWQGGLTGDGYGKTNFDTNRTRNCHRYLWISFYGPLEPGQCVLHHCDNRRCLNLNHLFQGSHTDNMRDMFKKGRAGGYAAGIKKTRSPD